MDNDIATNTVYSNKEDLKLIEEIGITPDISYHKRRPGLKAAGLAVIALLRMKKMSDDWAVQRKVHAQLVGKLEAMRRRSGRAAAKNTAVR